MMMPMIHDDSLLVFQNMKCILPLELMFALAGVLFVYCADVFVELREKNQDIRHYPLGLRWIWYMVLLSGIAFLGVFEDQAFIYFQF